MEQPEASQATATVTAADSETAVEPADGGATATATATDQSSIDAPAVASETSAAITASEIDDKAGPDDSTPPADKPVLGDVVGTAADVLGFGAWVVPSGHANPSGPDEFIAALALRAAVWPQIFKEISPDNEKRSGALMGAMQIAKATKSLEKSAVEAKQLDSAVVDEVKGGLQAGADQSDGLSSTDGEGAAVSAALACQSALKECILGFLDLSFTADEEKIKNRFPKGILDFEVSNVRLNDVAACVAELEYVFQQLNLDPAKTATPKGDDDDDVSEQLMEMLKAQMKKAGTKNKQSSGVSKKEQAKKRWDAKEGRMACVVGVSLWEKLCWHRGCFIHGYIAQHFNPLNDADVEVVPVPCTLLEQGTRILHHMLRTQGPIQADHDDISTWTPKSVAKRDQTHSMFHHGVFSSQHLIALKYQAELCYWRWRYYPGAANHAEWTVYTKGILKRFVHVTMELMVDTGWTCEVEKQRLQNVIGVQESLDAFLGKDSTVGEKGASTRSGMADASPDETLEASCASKKRASSKKNKQKKKK